MTNPLGPLVAIERRVLLGRAAGAFAVTGVVQLLTGRPLRNESAPGGIVSLELAGSADRANQILGSWEADGVLGWAAANVLLDYSFLAAYASLLVALAVTVAERGSVSGRPGLLTVGFAVAWGQWIAGAADSVENVGLLIMIAGHVSEFVASATRALAVIKFGLIALGIAWIVAGWVISRLGTRRQES